ncbi:MAG: undecaprenyl-diphosphate phosphatase [Bacteroidia bacterium]|nr:undecaprenyl-diphosphate phosphatase [Bacteroidia bacterium]
MDLFQAIILGVVQGLTEFIPISSTAHLRIVPALCGWPDPGAAFTAVTQIGTLVAVLLYFRGDLRRLSAAFLHGIRSRKPFGEPQSRMSWFILLGTLPIIVFGLLFKDLIETEFRSLWVISGSLILLALLLALAEFLGRRTRNISNLTALDIMLIGCAQALALIPGSSRSGTTITAGLFLNLQREDAARFSFLLSIPAISLSGVYQLWQLRELLVGDFGVHLLVATVVSGIVGYASIEFLLRFLRSHSTTVFILYRIGLGVLLIVMLSTQILQP